MRTLTLWSAHKKVSVKKIDSLLWMGKTGQPITPQYSRLYRQKCSLEAEITRRLEIEPADRLAYISGFLQKWKESLDVDDEGMWQVDKLLWYAREV